MLLCADVGVRGRRTSPAGAISVPVVRRGRLGPWGRGRERAVRLHRGERAVIRPPRGRCRACGATHVLLPSWMAPRRADSTGVIARAAAAAALHGTAARGSAQSWASRPRPCGAGCAACAPAPATCARTPRPRSASSPRAVTGPAWTRAGPLSAMPWPRSSRARGPRSPAMATPRKTSTPSSAASASPPPSRPRPAANHQIPSRASPCPDQGALRPRGRYAHSRAACTAIMSDPATPRAHQPGETPEMRTPYAHLQ